jgi:uncharacterized protein (DUF924 family)
MPAEEILAYWFADAAADPARASDRSDFWFTAAPAVDSDIAVRFAGEIDAAARGALDAWRDAPRPRLALVLLLDQFPRNACRGTPRAFAADDRALDVARDGIVAGHVAALSPIEAAFLLMPYQHAERLSVQRESVALFARQLAAAPAAWTPVLSEHLDFARQHLALVERFGRFPHRNAILGRASTSEEQAFLQAGGQTFGQTQRRGAPQA